MSNLAQVHRAFLMRKCPSTSIIRRGYYPSQNMTTTNEKYSDGDVAPNLFIDPLERQPRAKQEAPHISNARKICEMNPNYHLSKCYESPVVDPCMDHYKTVPHERYRYKDYLTRVDLSNKPSKSPSTMVNKTRALLWDEPTRTSSYHGNEDQNHERNQKRHSNGQRWSKSSSRLMYSLGVLGVFRRMTSDDIEEERKKLSDEDKVKKMTQAELLIAKGVLLLCDFDYDRADVLFHQALHLAQKDQNEEQETLVLNLLATNYFDNGKHDEAEKLFIDLIKRLIAKEMEPSDPAILELSLKLSSIYSKNPKNHTKAFRGFEFVINSLLYSLQDLLKDLEEIDVLDISEQQRNDLALLGWAYDWFARHLMVMNDYMGAVDMLKRALDISKKILGPHHDQTLILLNDIGTTLAMINKADEGRGYIKRAVEGALASQSEELASFYVNLGLVNLQLRKFDEAKRYCEYSIELASKNANQHNTTEILNLSQNCLNEVKRLLQVQTNQ